MATSVLEQYRISDLIDWFNRKQLKLNPHFQRRNVWSDSARIFLIDTVLRRLPMPKIFMRTKVDLTTKQSYRELVDGQQRVRAIIDFAQDGFTLNHRAGEFAGRQYSTLAPEQQEAFLSYPIAVDQLINASDNDVLEIFARLNSYNVSLNAPELRHAQFQGEFKWAVHAASREWVVLWEKYNVVSVRARLRMQDDSLMAEMFGIILDGVKDGGQNSITKLYRKYNAGFPETPTLKAINVILARINEQFGEVLLGSPISNAPHFLMLFAAFAHAIVGIPPGDIGDEMPRRDPSALSKPTVVKENLETLSEVLEAPDRASKNMMDFWTASSSSTQRIRSRRARFPVYWRALLPKPL